MIDLWLTHDYWDEFHLVTSCNLQLWLAKCMLISCQKLNELKRHSFVALDFKTYHYTFLIARLYSSLVWACQLKYPGVPWIGEDPWYCSKTYVTPRNLNCFSLLNWNPDIFLNLYNENQLKVFGIIRNPYFNSFLIHYPRCVTSVLQTPNAGALRYGKPALL